MYEYDDYDFSMAEWQATSMLDAIWDQNNEKNWKKIEEKKVNDNEKDWNELYPDDIEIPF